MAFQYTCTVLHAGGSGRGGQAGWALGGGKGRIGREERGGRDGVTCSTALELQRSLYLQYHATKSHSATRMHMLHHASAAHDPNQTSTPYMGASPCERACTYAMHACRNHAPHAHAHLHALSPVNRLHCRVRHDTGILQPCYGARPRSKPSQLSCC